MHGVERDGGVDERLAFLHRRGGDRHVHHVRPEPLAGDLERGLGAGGGLEEQIDLRPSAQGRALLLNLPVELDERLGEVEQAGDLAGGKAFDADEVSAGEREGGSILHGRREA